MRVQLVYDVIFWIIGGDHLEKNEKIISYTCHGYGGIIICSCTKCLWR